MSKIIMLCSDSEKNNWVLVLRTKVIGHRPISSMQYSQQSGMYNKNVLLRLITGRIRGAFYTACFMVMQK